MTKRYVIIANGDISDYQWHKALIKEDDFVVCADGGARHAVEMDIVPDLVLGDFDSLSDGVKVALAGSKCCFAEHPAEKDMTDSELVIRWCLQENPREIVMMGALGTRVDHSMANICLLTHVSSEIPVKLINEQNEIMLLKKRIVIHGQPGDLVSLIPLSDEVQGVNTRGLKYILRNDTLTRGTSRGVSNEMAEPEALVEISQGLVLVIRSWEQKRGLA